MNKYIYAIPVADVWLVYAPLLGISATINQAGLRELRKGNSHPVHNDLKRLGAALREEPAFVPVPRRGPINPEFLGLVPTRACNINCRYCGFGAQKAGDARMSPELAVAAVDWMADQVKNSGRERLKIHFFGGEPHLAADIIEIVVHHARLTSNRLGLFTHFETSTNGVFDEKHARFIGDCFDTVVLSFDGPMEFHQKTRPGSFADVCRTALRLSRTPADLCFRICVTHDSVSHLEEICRWFHAEFEPAVVSFESLKPTAESIAAGLQPPDPYEFSSRFVRARRELKKHGIESVYAADISETPKSSFCPVGSDALIVTPDGHAGACYLLEQEWIEKGLNMRLATLSPGSGLLIDETSLKKVREMVFQKPFCEDCFCRWSCAGGCHVTHSHPGRTLPDDHFCIQTRIVSVCTLLQELGEDGLVERVISSPRDMERLAAHRSYRLDDGI